MLQIANCLRFSATVVTLMSLEFEKKPLNAGGNQAESDGILYNSGYFVRKNNKGEIDVNNYNPPCRQKMPMQGNYAMPMQMPEKSCKGEKVNPSVCNKSAFPVNTALAMAYVPFQQSTEVYSYEKALTRGTIFPCLDKPFLMGCCK